jgi:hypothetical protein
MKTLAVVLLLLLAQLSNALAVDSGQCGDLIIQPIGGFFANNLSGYSPQTPIINIQLSGGGNATFAEISNTSDYSSDFAFFPITPGAENLTQWSLAPGYGLRSVYIRYLNSCKAMPSPTVILEVNFYPDYCSATVTPPPGGFNVTCTTGTTTTSPNVKLTLISGDAAYGEVSNYANFSNSTIFGVGYPYDNTIDWTLPVTYGQKIVYVRYLNICKSKPSAVVTLSINYVNPNCGPVTPPKNGFMVTSLSGSNVKRRNVTLGMFGGNASFMEVSNYSSFAGSTTLPYATTLPWMLTPSYGNKTVWARYWNACKTQKSIGVSVSFNYTP